MASLGKSKPFTAKHAKSAKKARFNPPVSLAFLAPLAVHAFLAVPKSKPFTAKHAKSAKKA